MPAMNTQHALPIKELKSAPSTIHISGKCNYREEGEIRVIFANGIPLLHYASTDKAAEQYAMIHLVESGLATQEEIIAAFGCSRPTLFRARRKYNEGGMAALVPKKTGPKEGSQVKRAMERRLLSLKNKGLSNAAIGSRLGLKEDTVRKALKRLGWSHQPKGAQEMELPLELSKVECFELTLAEETVAEIGQGDCCARVSRATRHPSAMEDDSPEPEQVSYDADPLDRSVDRAMARLGLVEDAAPVFQTAENIAHAGVLLAIPALRESGIFAVAKEGEDYLVTLLAEFILTDKRIEEIFLTAVRLAFAKENENN